MQDGVAECFRQLRSLDTVEAQRELRDLVNPLFIKHMEMHCGDRPIVAKLSAFTCLETLSLNDATCHQVLDMDCRMLPTTLTTLITNQQISLYHFDQPEES